MDVNVKEKMIAANKQLLGTWSYQRGRFVTLEGARLFR